MIEEIIVHKIVVVVVKSFSVCFSLWIVIVNGIDEDDAGVVDKSNFGPDNVFYNYL